MTHWFHVGQKVVCVDDAPRGGDKICFVEAGKVYTVRGIARWEHWRDFEPGCGIWLEEVKRPFAPDGREHPYDVNRFRPLITRKTDISIFTSLLTPKHEKIEEDA